MYCSIVSLRAVKSILGHPNAASLPVTLEEFDAGILHFDTVFSMGVMYHRKDPIHHLEQLKRWIKPGGQLILETLVIDGDETTCLVPPDRYARMKNVWFLPSVSALSRWLQASVLSQSSASMCQSQPLKNSAKPTGCNLNRLNMQSIRITML